MATREMTNHKTNECNSQIEILAHEPSKGGAPVRYDIFGPRMQVDGCGMVPSFGENLKFQDGPIADGINGITNEVLLAILIDRLEGFQKGPYACDENQEALENVCAALAVLKSRTLKREARGVEGTHTV